MSSSTVEIFKHSLIKLTGLGKSKHFSSPNSRNSTVPVSVKNELLSHIDLGLYVVFRYFSKIPNSPLPFFLATKLLLLVLTEQFAKNLLFPHLQQLSPPLEFKGRTSVLNSSVFSSETGYKPFLSEIFGFT